MSNNSTAPTSIRWQQIISLAALDLAILISWIAYHEFQPKLLEQFKFTEFNLALAVLQAMILVATPPIAGLAADRMIKRGGNRLPVVSIGINFVSMVFMIVAVTVFVNPGGWIRFFFPLMIALWLVAMNIFHSPAISMVETFVPAKKLPQIVAIFAILANLMAAIEPVVVDLILFFGGPLTFAVGGALVFTTGFLFVRSTKGLDLKGEIPEEESISRPEKTNFILVVLLGLILGAATTFIFKVAPTLMELQIPQFLPTGWKGNYMASLLIAASAVVAFPIGILTSRIGAGKMALISGIACAALILAIHFCTGGLAFFLYLLFPLAFAASSVSFLPLAFASVSKVQTVFGIGLFFSGIELAAGIVDIWQAMPK